MGYTFRCVSGQESCPEYYANSAGMGLLGYLHMGLDAPMCLGTRDGEREPRAPYRGDAATARICVSIIGAATDDLITEIIETCPLASLLATDVMEWVQIWVSFLRHAAGHGGYDSG
jgi:hypothetical protein